MVFTIVSGCYSVNMTSAIRPTRREERRAQTVREIKELAMRQVSEGGPDAVSLSGIVREMSMSPAAVYRYFDSRDALLADLVVDAYNELADSLVEIERGKSAAADHLGAVLRATRAWALAHPNSYRLIFQTSIGSGEHFAAERTVPAASRSMAVVVDAIDGMAAHNSAATTRTRASLSAELRSALEDWRDRTGLAAVSLEVLDLAVVSWTRLHGVISLEIGGHLAATGIGGAVLFDAEVDSIRAQAATLAG
jgi:AcrR family transcriptional regulator